MGAPDPRVGGFGPLFALELVLLLGLAPWIVKRRKQPGEAIDYPIFMATGIAVACAVFPEPWWARYVSLLWTAPLLVAVAGALSDMRN